MLKRPKSGRNVCNGISFQTIRIYMRSGEPTDEKGFIVRLAAFPILTAAILVAAIEVASAADSTEPTLVIKDHKFDPVELHVPAGKRITVTVENRDATPEEVESKPLRFEKIIPGGGKGIVRFGPLTPGTYGFFGDFHQDTAQGKVIAE